MENRQTDRQTDILSYSRRNSIRWRRRWVTGEEIDVWEEEEVER